MPIGQVLLSSDGNTDVYFSPWFSRGGNKATFVCDLIATAGLDDLSIQVQTKKAEDDDANSTDVGGTESISLGTINTQIAFQRGETLSGVSQGFEQLVRFKYSLTASSGETAGWAHFRMLNASWLRD